MRRSSWVALFLVLLLAATIVGVPVWLIRPFVSQTPDALDWSWALRQWAPLISSAGLLVGLMVAVGLWRGARWPGRTSLVLASLLLAAAAWFARQNHFEWMFRPFPDARFTRVAETKDVPDGEPIIGVAHARDALAFPIRRIGYHHLINTEVGRLPIVSTY